MGKIIKRTFIVVLLILIVLIAGSVYFLTNIDKNLDRDVFLNKDIINILLVGKETSSTVENESEDLPVHTDTMMVLKVNKKSNTAKLISIPRDTYFEYLPGSKKRHQKINAAYFLGGIDTTKEVVEDLLDINLDYYVEVDYKLVADIIDALGGIDINWEYDDYYYKDDWTVPPLIIDLKRGPNHLDGNNAVSYLRTRNVYAIPDLGRINAQQEFLLSLLNKIKEPKNIFKIPEMVSLFNKEAKTDIDFKESISLAYYAYKYLDKENLSIVTIPGADLKLGGIYYYKVDEKTARQIYLED